MTAGETAFLTKELSVGAFYVDDNTWNKLMSLPKVEDVFPLKADNSPIAAMRLSMNWLGLPIYRSSYLNGTFNDTPSFLHEFDRWFDWTVANIKTEKVRHDQE